jgi:chromosome segregation ATPase
LDQQTANTLGTIIGWILVGIFGYVGSRIAGRGQRQAVTLATSKLDESTKRQEEANDLLKRTLTDALSFKDSQLTDQRKEINELKLDNTNFKEALDGALREIDSMRNDMRGMRNDHDQQINSMKAQIAGLVKELHEKDHQLDALTKAVQERETMIGGQVQKLDRFERALAEKDTALMEAQTTIGNLKTNEQRTSDELNQLRERVRNLEAKVSELQAERGVLLAERDAARAEVLRVNTEKALLLARIDALEAQLRARAAVRMEAPPLNERDAGQIAASDLQAELGKAEAGA